MRVRCIAELPSPEQARRLGKYYRAGEQAFAIELGREYLVLGLELLGEMPWVEIEDDYEQVSAAPICLFEITDPAVPSLWEARLGRDWTLRLWPSAFYRDGFFEDLLERKPEAVSVLRSIRSQLGE